MVTADITGDGMEDLILVFDNSTGGGKDVSAFSGTGGFESLWTSTFSSIGSLKYSLYRHIFVYIDVIFSSFLSRVQALANLNEDNVPDVVLQITGKLMPNATSNSTWVYYLSIEIGCYGNYINILTVIIDSSCGREKWARFNEPSASF